MHRGGTAVAPLGLGTQSSGSPVQFPVGQMDALKGEHSNGWISHRTSKSTFSANNQIQTWMLIMYHPNYQDQYLSEAGFALELMQNLFWCLFTVYSLKYACTYMVNATNKCQELQKKMKFASICFFYIPSLNVCRCKKCMLSCVFNYSLTCSLQDVSS